MYYSASSNVSPQLETDQWHEEHTNYVDDDAMEVDDMEGY